MSEPAEAKQTNHKHWYARYPRDYQDDTAHLSLTEHGVYAVLLDSYYITEKPLPANAMHLQRICRAFEDYEVEALQSVLRQFFKETPDGYRNDRADRELAKRADISGKRKGAAHSRHTQAASGSGKHDAIGDAKAPAIRHAIAHANADTPTPTITTSGDVTREMVRSVADKVLDLIPRGHDTPGLVGGAWSIVEVWLKGGADPDRDIYPTILHLLKTTPNPNSLKYFNSAIGRATKTRLATAGEFSAAQPETPRNGSGPPRRAKRQIDEVMRRDQEALDA